MKDGKIDKEKSDSLRYALETCRDGLYILKLSKVGTRNNAQNRYYRGVVLKIITEETGEEAEDLHDFFKKRFLLDEGEPSTTEKNKSDFAWFVDKVKDYALQELCITIPDAQN